ncbi:MAG: DsrE family protein [Flavobacteriaceae bacterium]
MKRLLLIGFSIFVYNNAISQDSIPPYLVGKISYPVIQTHPYEGVIDIESNALKYDSSLEYKIAIDLYDKVGDSASIYIPLREVARVYNLNIANGVPIDKLKIAAVIHGYGMDAILNNEKYKEKYDVENPNTETINQLIDLGVDFYVCGQNLGMFNVSKDDILSGIQVPISAKTTFITLDQMGYSYLNVNED